MREHSRFVGRKESRHDEDELRPSPGKRTLTDHIYRRVAGPAMANASTAAADHGVAGAASSLPHLDQIQSAFGAHDVSGVRVADDAGAQGAARSLGARAYAFGERVATTGSLDLHTAAHEAAHVVQQRAGVSVSGGMSQPGDHSEREADAVADAVASGGDASGILDAMFERGSGGGAVVQRVPGDTLHPEEYPTYELWISQFRDLPVFRPTDGTNHSTDRDHPHEQEDNHGFPTYGTGPADRDEHRGRRHPGQSSSNAVPNAVSPQAADRFIDHPTDAWVRAHLPEELRQTAYRLPTDCADIAAVLRHVWLVAHHRTETHTIRTGGNRTRSITLGEQLGGGAPAARQAALGREISGGRGSNGISSASAPGLVNAYRDAGGALLVNWNQLQPILHAGDIVVWEHRNRENRAIGGHVQTIQSVTRSGPRITAIETSAGNQPLGQGDADRIHDAHRGERSGQMSTTSLRNAPGRRIERQGAVGEIDRDDDPLTSAPNDPTHGNIGRGPNPSQWGRLDNASTGAYTVAIAVGPADASNGAGPTRRAGVAVNLSDYTPRIQAARDVSTLQGLLENALGEARATVEGGGVVTATDVTSLGTALATRARELAPTDGGAALRATMLRVVEAFAPVVGSTDDTDLNDAAGEQAPPNGGARNSRNARAPQVRAAFAPLRTALQ